MLFHVLIFISNKQIPRRWRFEEFDADEQRLALDDG